MSFFRLKTCPNCFFCSKEAIMIGGREWNETLNLSEREQIKNGSFDFLKAHFHLKCYHDMWAENRNGADISAIRNDLNKTKCHLFYDFKKAPETATFAAIISKLSHEKEQAQSAVKFWVKKPVSTLLVILLTVIITAVVTENRAEIVDAIFAVWNDPK